MFQGLKQGKGKIIYVDGSIFIGEFHNDLKHGVGTQTSKDNSFKFEGTYENGYKSGPGKENYPDNSYYEGNFSKGKKNGPGNFFLSNGARYVGEFTDDRIEGKGKFTWSKEKEYEGGWVDNCLSGFGVFKKNGQIHKGYFYNDKKHGYGVNYLNQEMNSYTVGTWVENEMQGIFIHFHNNEIEKIIRMNKNKVKKVITDENELIEVKASEDYRNIQNFYQKMISSNSAK